MLEGKSFYTLLGDSRELLKLIPDNSVDLILTDPPYNLAQHSTGNINLPNRSALNNDIAPWDKIDFFPEDWTEEFIRILKPKGNLFIFTSYNQLGKWYDLLDKKFDTTNFLVWHKTNPAPKIFKAGFLNSCELVYTCWNKGHTWNFISQAEMHNFIESPICMSPERLKNPKHPAQKPIAVLKKLIAIASNPYDIVFDPFMGVGSIGVAALQLNRKFIGYEINPMYYTAAEKRIKEQAFTQTMLQFEEIGELKQMQPITQNQPIAGSLKPIIKWPGGKEKEIPYIRRYAPDFFDNYYEPFVGGGSVYTAFNAKHFYINDKSQELIALYNALAHQNASFFAWIENIMQAWSAMLSYVTEHQELVEWYLKLRNNEINDTAVIGLLHNFIEQEWKNLQQILPAVFEWDLNIYKTELHNNLKHKFLRMHKIEIERGQMPNADIYDNVETAFMSALYMYFRGLYNDKQITTEYPQLATALFVYLRNFAYSGMFRYNANGDFNVPYGGMSYNHKNIEQKICYYHSPELLQHLANTTITNLDFEDFLRLHQPTEKDFIFLDPPYDTEFSTYAQNEFNKQDQIRLADFLCNECKGKWLMIIKYTDFIFNLYNREGIEIRKFDKKYQVSFMNRNDKEVEHLIIMNYKNQYD